MLTISNYDTAVVEYFESFYDNVVYGSPSVAFKNAAMKNNDKVKLPLISIYRSDLSLTSLRNYALFKKGNISAISEDKVTRERILPITFSYQADIWASTTYVAAQLFSEVLFRTLDKPTVLVHHDGFKVPIEKYLRVTDIIDNSDATQISTRGRLNRYTIIYQLDGHIAKIVENDRIYIVPEFYSYDGKELK